MSEASPTIFFVRHGETAWNAEGRLQGQQDIPLNALGRAQAEEVAARIRRLAPHFQDLDYVASPMARTRHTMELMRQTLGLPSDGYRLDARLKELTFGTWEGLTWKQVRAQHPELAAARERDKWGFVPPEGESYAMLAERVRPAIEEMTRDTVVVAHGGVARAVLNLFCGVSSKDAPRVDIWQGRVLVVRGRVHSWE